MRFAYIEFDILPLDLGRRQASVLRLPARNGCVWRCGRLPCQEAR
ncbi:MAG: RNA recognition motif domain-containing protein [Zoogloeaceae bacterium]|nr:RNA recognition motif domain-containing protein [Zoogloeaceae bacterium]